METVAILQNPQKGDCIRKFNFLGYHPPEPQRFVGKTETHEAPVAVQSYDRRCVQ